MIGKEIKPLSNSSIDKINEFLPEELKSEVFCERCGLHQERVEMYHIYVKYKRYHNNLDEEIHKIRKEEAEAVANLTREKMKYFINFDDLIKFYSYVPSNITPIELIESQIIVDSGMWSTSSDNLDALWSAMHDKVARDGIDSKNKINEGFSNIKDLLKRECFIRGGNTVVDIKYNFSELAGNGKVLFHIQGTASINPEIEIPKFDNIEKKYSDSLSKLINKRKEVFNRKYNYSIENFVELIKTTT